jgi:hypothetical protein
MKVILLSIMIFLGTLIAAALVALGEPAEAQITIDAGWLSPLRGR